MPLLWAIRALPPWHVTEAIRVSGSVVVTTGRILATTLGAARARVPAKHQRHPLKAGRRDGLIEVWSPQPKESA